MRLLAANARVLRAENRLSITGWLQQAALAAVVVGGGILAERGSVRVGEVATVALALRRLFGPLDSMAWLDGQAVSSRARLARILDLIGDSRPRFGDEGGAVAEKEAGEATLRIDGVTFAYDGGPAVLAGVTLRVAAGEHVAIVGPSGAGKSTLAKLVAGLLEPQTGTVTLGGRKVTTGPGHRRRIVLIPQEGHVSAGTLADNLRLVSGAHTDEALARAVDAAGLTDWVMTLPDGIETVLADRGANLSAGERQLVALARAALADPEVLVLDEATADVDPATEAAVSTALGRLGSGRTPCWSWPTVPPPPPGSAAS